MAVKEFGGKTIILAIDADRNDQLPSRREVFFDGAMAPSVATT